MSSNNIKLIFLLVLYFEYSTSVKTCCNWSDYWNFFRPNTCRNNQDAEDDFVAIVGRWGRGVETHSIQTYDGYILTLFRILPDEDNKPPVLLLHGSFMNSLAFVNRGNKSLAYQFVRTGYDVWILNWRGTKYSKRHITMNSKETAFWQFSLHELGIYDLPQALYEIKKWNLQKVLVVGFSTGNTVAFIYATLYPEEAKEALSGMVALSPTGAPINIGLPAKLKYMSTIILKPFIRYNHGEVPPSFQSLRATVFCRKGGIWIARLCDASFMITTGLDFEQQDPATLPVIIAVNKDSDSFMAYEHLYQMARYRRFQMFDYGFRKNLAIYGQSIPPKYDLSKLNVPQIFFIGKNDKSGSLQDAVFMYQNVPIHHQTELYIIDHDKFGLADFVQAKDINDLLHFHLMNCVTALVPPVRNISIDIRSVVKNQ